MCICFSAYFVRPVLAAIIWLVDTAKAAIGAASLSNITAQPGRCRGNMMSNLFVNLGRFFLFTLGFANSFELRFCQNRVKVLRFHMVNASYGARHSP